MADEKLSIAGFKELAIVLGLGGGMAGSTYWQNQTIKEQVLSNKELAEQVRDSLAVRDILLRQKEMENDVSLLKEKTFQNTKDISWLGAVCEKKEK